MTDLRILRIMIVNMEIVTKEMAMVLLEIRAKAKEISEVPCMVKVEDVVGLIKVQRLDAQECQVKQWTKTKCDVIIAMNLENVQRNRDEEEVQHFSGMNSDYYENDGYTDVYDEDYDDEVFATLNS